MQHYFYPTYDKVIFTAFINNAMSLTKRCVNAEFLVSDSLYMSEMSVQHWLGRLS